MRRALAGEGYSVLATSSGVQGLRCLVERPPDLVLLDLMLPDLDGWEICERIRSLSTIPTILLTAHLPSPAILRRLGLDYIIKPVHLAGLGARVNAALRRAHMPPPSAIGCTFPHLE